MEKKLNDAQFIIDKSTEARNELEAKYTELKNKSKKLNNEILIQIDKVRYYFSDDRYLLNKEKDDLQNELIALTCEKTGLTPLQLKQFLPKLCKKVKGKLREKNAS